MFRTRLASFTALAAVVLVAGAFFFYLTRSHSAHDPDLSPEPIPSVRPERPGRPGRNDAIAAISRNADVAPSALEGGRDEARAKVQVLDEIFASRNDNDPRLDTQLRNLTPADKRALRERYESLPLESRNQRGTIVFLIGRALSSPEDFQFLDAVLHEKPCLSPQDCSKPFSDPSGREDEHGGGQIRLVLAYPQIVALKAVETALETSADPGLRTQVEKIIAAGEASSISEVAELARKIRAGLAK